MELDYGGATLTRVGGFLPFPDVVYGNQPVVVGAEQINVLGSPVNLINVQGGVISMITGAYINGVNANYPGSTVNGVPVQETVL